MGLILAGHHIRVGEIDVWFVPQIRQHRVVSEVDLIPAHMRHGKL